MRIVALVAIAACSEPTGLAQTWPPSRGIAVEAVVATDLDADGATDALVYASGDAHQAGIYRLASSDIATVATAFTSFTPLALGHPSAGAVATVDGSPDVLAAHVSDGVRVDALGALNTDDVTLTDLSAGNAALWVRTLTFPGTMQRIVVSTGTAIEHDSLDTVDAQRLPPPSGTAWAGAVAATTFTSASAFDLAVATPRQIYTTTLTGTNTSAATWTMVRDGDAWAGQVAVDLGGSHEFFVGVDLGTHQLCAIDPDGGTTACVALGVSASEEVDIIQFRQPTGIALAITQSDDAQTDVTLVTDIAASQTALTATVTALPPVAIGHARPVAVTRFAGAQPRVLLFAGDGSVACGAGC